ncbi:dienelactone hydrolase [Neorhizobium sp. JUb45]|nr:dienelactone hydrolase [Neorhizobium sp. JUb45]
MRASTITFRAGAVDYLANHYPHDASVRILMFPDWEGCQTASSDRLARLYAQHCDAEVVVTDLYGAARRPADYGEVDCFISAALADPLRTRSILKAITTALETTWKSNGPLIIVGFCFGGSLAFEAARAGIECMGAVSIHGQPNTKVPLTGSSATAAFLMLQGSEDPFIRMDALYAFMTEMRNMKTDWSLYMLGNAKHSFTREDIGSGNMAVGYSLKADREAALAVQSFATRLLQKQGFSVAPPAILQPSSEQGQIL